MAAIGRRGGEARGHARGANAQNAGQNARTNADVVSSNPSTPTGSDRQVAIDNQRDGMSQRAATSDKNSLGNERRPASSDSTRGEQNLEKR
jgi:hypothetical protein